MKNIVLITAGGIGSRMGSDIPKQFISIYDKPAIIYTLEKFQQHPQIDAILVVCLAGWVDVLKNYARKYKITKLKHVVLGGHTNQESIEIGTKYLVKIYKDKKDIVIVHDGNRPNVATDLITNSIKTCRKHGNAIAVIPCTAVLLKSTSGTASKESVSRNNLWSTQTPHAFYIHDLLKAHQLANKMKIHNTAASCELYTKLGKTVYLYEGSETNIKLTTVSDIHLFKKLLKTEGR